MELTGLQRSFKNLALARVAENAGPGVWEKVPSIPHPQAKGVRERYEGKGMRESSPPGRFCWWPERATFMRCAAPHLSGEAQGSPGAWLGGSGDWKGGVHSHIQQANASPLGCLSSAPIWWGFDTSWQNPNIQQGPSPLPRAGQWELPPLLTPGRWAPLRTSAGKLWALLPSSPGVPPSSSLHCSSEWPKELRPQFYPTYRRQ